MKQTNMSRTARAGSCAVQTAGLTKRFGGRTAVDPVDLLVPAGTAFGYLGPNGAGKTTLIRMLLGLTAATSGAMRLLGHPVPAERSAALLRVGAMAEEPRFLGYLTGRESLRINAAAREPAAQDRIKGRWSGWAWPSGPVSRWPGIPPACGTAHVKRAYGEWTGTSLRVVYQRRRSWPPSLLTSPEFRLMRGPGPGEGSL